MTLGGGKGGQFFVGAIGGLALAVLLVGVVSFLPPAQHNGALQANTNQHQPQEFAGGAGAGAAYSSNATTAQNTPAAQSTVSAPSIAHTASPGGGAAASASGAQAKAGLAANSSATASSSSSSNQDNGPGPPAGVSASRSVTREQQQQSAPNSLLVHLPQEGVGNLLATFSPLLVGLLVALLIYAAFTRRQDSSS